MSMSAMMAVWNHSKHNGTELLMLLAIADQCNDEGFCYPGVERLAKKARVSERHAKRVLHNLTKKGELVIHLSQGTPTRQGKTNLYELTLITQGKKLQTPMLSKRGVTYTPPQRSTGDTQDTPTGDTQDTPTGDTQDTRTHSIETIEEPTEYNSILDHIDDQAPEPIHAAAAADSVPRDAVSEPFEDKEVAQAVRVFFSKWPLSKELSSDEQTEWLAAVHKFMARQKAEFPKQFSRLIAFIGGIQDAGNIHKPLGFLRHVLEDGIPPKATTHPRSESPRPPNPMPDLPMGDDGNLILPFHTDIDFSKVKTYTRDEARLIALAGGIQQAKERTL